MQLLNAVPVFWRFIVTLACAAIIVMLSVTPGNERSEGSFLAWLVIITAEPVQKVLHVVMYAILAFMWMWSLEEISSRAIRISLAFSLSVGIGAGLEIYQITVPGRIGTLVDALLNASGAVIGLLAAILLF